MVNSRGLIGLLVLVAIISFQSCVPYKKQVYLHLTEEMANGKVAEYDVQKEDYRLQADDIVDIRITSPVKDAQSLFSAMFNASDGVQNMQQNNAGGDVYYMTGYVVNKDGQVKIPVLGLIDVAGKTTGEVEQELETELLKYFKPGGFYVTVKLGGLRFSVMGEVSNPGRFVVLETRYNIFQAVAHVGDLEVFADRANVVVMRVDNGQMQVHKIDLLSEDVVESPVFYIQPNDVIYVRPLRSKTLGVGATFIQNFNTVVSLISTTLSLYITYQLLKSQD